MNEIEVVVDLFEKQIQALYTNDFEKFISFMTPRIQKELTIDIFQKAIDLYKRTPIGIEAIDQNKSRMYNEGESEEIPDKHVRLVLLGSGRTLCHVVNINGTWLIDDIYWRLTDSEAIIEETIDHEETPEPTNEPESKSHLVPENTQIITEEKTTETSSNEEEVIEDSLSSDEETTDESNKNKEEGSNEKYSE